MEHYSRTEVEAYLSKQHLESGVFIVPAEHVDRSSGATEVSSIVDKVPVVPVISGSLVQPSSTPQQLIAEARVWAVKWAHHPRQAVAVFSPIPVCKGEQLPHYQQQWD